MSTSLAPALDMIVVADLEEDYLLRSFLKPLTWLRYIDDVFTVWPHAKGHFQVFVMGLNGLAPRIKFTCESSPLSAIFLDLCIYKLPDFAAHLSLSTSIHYKDTNSFSYATGSSHIAPHTFRGIAGGKPSGY